MNHSQTWLIFNLSCSPVTIKNVYIDNWFVSLSDVTDRTDEEWFIKWGGAESLTHLSWHGLIGWLCKFVLARFIESHTAKVAQLQIAFGCNCQLTARKSRKQKRKKKWAVAMASGIARIWSRELLVATLYGETCFLSGTITADDFKHAACSFNLALDLGRLQERRSHFKHSLHSPRCRHTTHRDTYLLCWRVKMSTAQREFISW